MEKNKKCCNDIQDESLFPRMSLAYAYVLPQIFRNIYSEDEALCRGTLFKELDIPITEYGK